MNANISSRRITADDHRGKIERVRKYDRSVDGAAPSEDRIPGRRHGIGYIKRKMNLMAIRSGRPITDGDRNRFKRCELDRRHRRRNQLELIDVAEGQLEGVHQT